MLFCLLTIPCLATLAIIRRELNSTGLAVLEAAALFLLAFILTFIVFQVGSLLQIGTRLLS
jgi:ferrous iron transport protein B